MKVSIGKKLGAGFGVVIALMVVSATIAYFNLGRMNRAVGNVVDLATPALRASDQLLNGVNESLAALRGYMILGKAPQQAKTLRANRADAWQKIDNSSSDLERNVHQWNDRAAADHLTELRKVLEEFRDAQQAIEETAHTDENIASRQLLDTEAAPRAAEALTFLTAVIDAEKTEEASQDRKELFAALADSRVSFSHGLAHIRAYLLAGEEKSKRDFEQQWQAHQQAYERARSMEALFTPAQRQNWQSFVTARSGFAPLPERIFALRQADDWNKAEFLLAKEAAPRAQRLQNALAQITASADARQQKGRADMDAASSTVKLTLWLATLIAMAIGSAIAIILSRKIASTMRRLATRADEISHGDLTGTALLAKSSDELGQLADGFDAMLGNLKDLTGQILSVTENVNSATSQISSSAKQQASSTKEQASTVQAITSTMQEIAQSGSQILDKAKEVAAAAESAAQQSKSGISAVRGTSQTMESIREQVEEVAESIVALSEKTQAVGDIISTVNDIAEQSNLLALNATIEAAEAGEDGNRFSVVANEMKNLADQAKDCTIQVRNILGEIQKGINSAVMLTEEAVKRVDSGKQQAEVSEEAIRRMSEMTGESVQAFQQIIGATNQQQIGFEQVSQGMKDIDQATQQAATGTVQLEQAVVSLSAMSQQLKSAVSTYKLQA